MARAKATTTPLFRVCTSCQASLSPADFYERAPEVAARSGRYSARCRECEKTWQRGFRAAHPERVRARDHRYYADKGRAKWLRQAYGLTLADYDEMVRAQNGLCAICAEAPNGRWGRFHVDHDHATGEIRGLLCGRCNKALGLLRDDPAQARAAAAYLENGGV